MSERVDMEKRNGSQVTLENIIVVPPDGGWGWVVVLAAFYCIFVMDGIANTYGLLLPVFQKEFDASLSEVSLINSLFTGFYFLFGPIASSLSNRFGFRAIIISGSIVSAFGIGISVFNTSVQLMFLTYGFVGGLGFSLMYINVLLTVGFYFERWRALATGITVSASGAGTFSFAPAVQALLESYTWRHVLVGYAGLVFLCSAVAVCFRPLTPIRLQIDVDEPNPPKTRETSKRMVHSNVNYPTAADATNLSSNFGSKASIRTNIFSSLESVEVRGQPGRDSSIRFPRRSTFARSSYLGDIESVSETDVKRYPLDIVYERKTYEKVRVSDKFSNWDCNNCCKCKKQRGLRPLYRDDIFYDGSLAYLPFYEKNAASNRGSVATTATTTAHLSGISNRALFYNMSVSRLPTRLDLEEEEDRKFHVCPERLIRVLKTMFDLSIVRIPTFLLFLVSTSLLALGALVPIQFSYVRAVELRIMNKDEASLMLSAMGITNTIGRIVCGLLGSIRRVNIILLHVVCLLVGAFLNTGVVFFLEKTVLYVYATLYGFVLAEQGCLRSIILVQLVGLENLTNAFGILLLFLGIFTIVGTPLAGYLKEVADSYNTVFYYSSGILILSAAFAVPIMFWKKYNERRNHLTNISAPNQH